MPKTCCIKNCSSKQYSTTMFSVNSKCPIRSQQWMEAIKDNVKTGRLTKKPFVCIKHFREEDVEKEFVNVVDGVEHRMPRRVPRLVGNALPSVFKQTIDSVIADVSEQVEDTQVVSGEQAVLSKNVFQDLNQHYTYQDLLGDLTTSPLPDGWKYGVSQDNLLLVNLTSVQKSPIVCYVDKEMIMKVHVLDVILEKDIGDSYESLRHILNELSCCALCVGLDDELVRRHGECERIVKHKNKANFLPNRCKKCNYVRKLEKRREIRRSIRTRTLRKNIQQVIDELSDDRLEP